MIFKREGIAFEECTCDLCGKKVGYYSISGTFDFLCLDCFKEDNKK